MTECGRAPSGCCGADACRRTLMLTMEASCRCSAAFSICISSPARSPASCVRRCICQCMQHPVTVLKQIATAWHAVEITQDIAESSLHIHAHSGHRPATLECQCHRSF